MRIFILIIVSAALGLAASIFLYKTYNVNVPPLFTGLSITAIGYMLFNKWLMADVD
jgi:hypothetical protein